MVFTLKEERLREKDVKKTEKREREKGMREKMYKKSRGVDDERLLLEKEEEVDCDEVERGKQMGNE